MSILKDVKAILEQQNPHEKMDKIEQLSDVFEYVHDLSKGDVAEGVQLLLAAALQEPNENVRESFFHAINNAVVDQHVGSSIDWDTLATSLPSLSKWDLDYALNILGISGQSRYLPVLEEYARHADPETRESAQQAVVELKHLLAHTSQKESV